MIFNMFFWLLFGAATLLAVIETAYSAKVEEDARETYLWHLREFLTMIVIVVGVVMFALLAHEYDAITTNKCNLIIGLAIILMPLRKIADVCIWKILLKKIDAVPTRFVDTNESGKDFKNTVKIGYHILLFLLSTIVFLVISLFPGVFVTRIQVVINTWSNIAIKLPGSVWDRIVVLVWLISILILVGLIVNLIRIKYQGLSGMFRTLSTIILVFITRKIFLYIFVMDKYIIQDIIFWVVVAIIGFILLMAITILRGGGGRQ